MIRTTPLVDAHRVLTRPVPFFAPHLGARVLRLEAGAHGGAVRYVSAPSISLGEGARTSWVTLTRTGTFSDPRYGSFAITREMLLAMVENFSRRTYGQDIHVDVAHRPDNGSAGKLVELALEGGKLRGKVEWTEYGVEAVRSRGYQYLSVEYHENWTDNEQGKAHGPVLLGAGLTIRPVIKQLDPVMLSDDGATPTLLSADLSLSLSEDIRTMWKELIAKLRAQLATFKLAEAVIDSLAVAAEKALGPVTDKTAAESLVTAFEASGKKLAESIGDKPVSIEIQVPQLSTGVSADDVKRILAEQAKAEADKAKQLAETVGAKKKLFADTINAAKGLDDAAKKELTEAASDLITPELTDDQIKRFAELQLSQANKLVAARSLAAMGFAGGARPSGSPHIEVVHGNEVKALQEHVDKRMGYVGMADIKRYKATGGALPAENKDLADRVLAQFDAANAQRLMSEHKALAAGDSVVSDVAVPAIFERTVIREALYQLIGTQFADVGSLPFATVAQIPYSYRDTTAAGVAGVRKFEGQSIARAAVKQALEESRPIPQKLAFEVSDELRYLTSNGQLDWDAVAENTRNAARIIGEDTEALIFNEVLNASDQFAVTAVSNEAVATGNGTNRIFPLDNFPVVRPKQVFDLQGVQVGSTLYPITVTVNAVNRPAYDGTNTQAAGIYWIMNYNLGEINFVTELGVPTAVPNTQAIVCSYSYTTNVHKWDSDLGALAVDAKWDDFLYRYGLRKAVVENDRFYSADFGLMSGTLRTQIEQARQFAANYARSGTSLQVDGNLGQIKGLANFRTTAPGLYMGDQRLVVGVRGTTRWRMMKPWAMGMLENQRDANGRFTGKKEAYGDQYAVCMTPTQLKGAYTSMVVYSAAARIDRVS